MVHSLDRAVADTTTYYNVYAMLSTTDTTTIQSLDPTRNTDEEQIKRDLLEDVVPKIRWEIFFENIEKQKKQSNVVEVMASRL